MERRRLTPAGDVAARREAERDRDVPAPRTALEDDRAELERRLDLAMEASSAGAWSWNSRTNRSTWDDRYHVMYGFAADEPRSYEAWLASAEDAVQSLQRRGVTAERFTLDVDAAAAWAEERGEAFNSASRAAYVATLRPKSRRP